MSQDKPQSTRRERLQERSRQRRESQKQELRQAILDAAGELFLAHGYTGFSLRQVAEHIGYAPGTIYLYFEDKDDLLFHVADEGFRRFSHAQQQASAEGASDEPLNRIRALAEAYVAFGLENPAYYRLMFIERPDLMFRSHEPQARAWLRALDDYQEAFRTAAGALLGESPDLSALSDLWWAALHGIVALANSMPFLYDPPRVKRMLNVALAHFFEQPH